jgi:hypothetical protein
MSWDGNFILTVFTDNYPGETTWELVNDCDDGNVVLSGGNYSTKATTYVEESQIEQSRYTLNIYDSFGDGICCKEGQGYFSATMDGFAVGDGGDFGDSYSTTFGSCFSPSPSEQPPLVPTESPTISPSARLVGQQDASFLGTAGGVCGGTSGELCFQSFTAETTAELTDLRTAISDTYPSNGAGSIKIYEGDCPRSNNCASSPGKLLGESVSVTSSDYCDLSIAGGNARYLFPAGKVLVTANMKYTFEFVGVGGYNRLGAGATYAGGRDYHPQVNGGSEGDVPFVTYVAPFE